MIFDTNVALLVRDDLAIWQKLNSACGTSYDHAPS